MDETNEKTMKEEDETEAASHYKKGRDAEDRGQIEKAHDEFAKAVAITNGANQIYVDAYERTHHK
jgi:flagellar biosynthesis protein FlhB